jgi:hypothetical protein
MEAHQPSFMLLPNFSFLPDQDVRLGTILTSAKGSKLPDPRRPLNGATRKDVDPSLTREQTHKPWSWDSSKDFSAKGGLHAEISFLTGICGSMSKDGAKGKSLVIACDQVHTLNFQPTSKYLAQAVQDDNVRAIGQKRFGPLLYMVVGLVVATGAEITVMKNSSHGGSANLSVDATQLGAPLNVGLEGGYNKASKSRLTDVPSEPFILAYEIRRLRMKKDGSVSERDENKWALFDDETTRGDEARIAEFERIWEVDTVAPSDLLSDE